MRPRRPEWPTWPTWRVTVRVFLKNGISKWWVWDMEAADYRAAARKAPDWAMKAMQLENVAGRTRIVRLEITVNEVETRKAGA